jgi:hypothetical protein
VVIPGTYTPASIALWVTGALKPLLCAKAVDLEEDFFNYICKEIILS